MHTCIGYVRVSTEGQASEGVSLQAQEASIRAWAKANGYEVGKVLSDTLSGKRADNRPGLVKALKECCKKKAPLVVYSLSRMSRSLPDALAIAEKLRHCDAGLVSVSENVINTTSATGNLIFSILSALSEFERSLISERTRSAMAYQRTKGKRISGVRPFGYRIQGDDLIPVPEEMEAIKTMLAMRDNGSTLTAIAQAMESRGIATANGGQWTPATVRGIILRAGKL